MTPFTAHSSSPHFELHKIILLMNQTKAGLTYASRTPHIHIKHLAIAPELPLPGSPYGVIEYKSLTLTPYLLLRLLATIDVPSSMKLI